MDHTTSSTPVQFTGRPWVLLVDAQGFGVPDCERHTPTCPPDPDEESVPETWPAWTDNWFYNPTEGLLPPIRGGSEEAESFEPTAEDYADYAQWAAELDARRDQEGFYRRHPLSEFNDLIRND